jgi:hypothetical protein
VSALGLVTRPQQLGLQPGNSPILRKYKLAECGGVQLTRARSGAAGIPSAPKTNWQSYRADRKPLRSILRKRTGRLNNLILQVLILKILKRLIRFRKLSALSRRPSVKAKTNWHAYPRDSIRVSPILAKQTGTLKSLILSGIILKILKKFIRCEEHSAISHQRPAKDKTNPNEAIEVNPNLIRNMHNKFRKRSHCRYRTYYLEVAAKKGLFFEKNEWTSQNPSANRLWAGKGLVGGDGRVGCGQGGGQ